VIRGKLCDSTTIRLIPGQLYLILDQLGVIPGQLYVIPGQLGVFLEK